MCLFDVGAGRFSLVFAFGVGLLALRLCRLACGIVCFHVGISAFCFLALRFSRWPLAMVFCCFSFRVVLSCLPTNFPVGFQHLASALGFCRLAFGGRWDFGFGRFDFSGTQIESTRQIKMI